MLKKYIILSIFMNKMKATNDTIQLYFKLFFINKKCEDIRNIL